MELRLSRRGPQLLGDCGCGLLHGVSEHARGRPLTGSGQVVVEAGQLDLASDPPVHHLGAHATLADEQPLVDQLLDRLPHRRPGQAELVGQGDLALEPVAGLERPGLDRLLDLGGHLRVQRHRAEAVDGPREWGLAHDTTLGRMSTRKNVLTNS